MERNGGCAAAAGPQSMRNYRETDLKGTTRRLSFRALTHKWQSASRGLADCSPETGCLTIRLSKDGGLGIPFQAWVRH